MSVDHIVCIVVPGTWIYETAISGPASQAYLFGAAVAVDGDGSNLYVGAMESTSNALPAKMGQVHVWTRSGAWGWTDSGSFIQPDTNVAGAAYDAMNFGCSISIQGDVMVVGAYTFEGTGGAFVFQRCVMSASCMPGWHAPALHLREGGMYSTLSVITMHNS